MINIDFSVIKKGIKKEESKEDVDHYLYIMNVFNSKNSEFDNWFKNAYSKLYRMSRYRNDWKIISLN